MKGKKAQQQKYEMGIKTGFIWDELDRKYGILETNNFEVVI